MENDKYIGRLLDGRYEILEPIGFGGMAVVYKARCHRLNRLVAVKILKDELSKDEEFRNRFHAESQAVAMLSHPNIMSVYDVSTHDDADYIVMELIDGITLKQYMEKKGTLNWKETLHFAMQIAKALEHAHGRGIVHRDIKPHNVMVLKNGSAKVTDFGIARLMSQSNTLTKEALGSVHYISPEQAKGGRVDNRSDLYSLGVVMYEMMTGRAPYDGDSPVAVAIQHINGGAVMPSVLNPNIPGGLEQIIMKCMATDPGQRYSSATALLYDLEELRKNPEILFPFGGEDALDEVLKVYPGKQNRQNQPRTTAERVAGARSDRSGASRTAVSPAVQQTRTRQQSQEPARRQDQHSESRNENRRRAVTTTVVVCSTVAVIAIIIFLVMLFNGGLLGNNNTLVPVPQLLGQVYDELDISRYPTVEIVLADYDYSPDVAVGVIMKQSPEYGEQVALNSKVKVWVSMGPEQEELNPQLARLTGRPRSDAEDYIEAFNLRPLVQEEYSEEMAAGLVIRAEAAEPDKPLEEGDTILIYVSLGKEIKTARVPEGLVGEKYTDAVKILNNNGFEKVTPKEEPSLEEKDTVTRLSVEPGSEIDVTTEIILYYSSGEIIERMPNVNGLTESAARETLEEKGFKNISVQEEYHDTVAAGKVIRANIVEGDRVDVTTRIILTLSLGPKPTEPPVTTAPPQPTKAPEVTKSITIALPSDMTEEYNLSIEFEEEMVVNIQLTPDTATYEFSLTGSGTGEYSIYIDGELLRTETVNFGA